MNEKKKLRSALREQYKQLNASHIAEIDKALIARVEDHRAYQTAKQIFLYASVANEVDTKTLIANAYKNGKTVALPKCEAMGKMQFFAYDGNLIEGRYHILEPTSDVLLEPAEDDVIIVPGLAFDKMGYRMGQGGGYYDRYLSKYRCISIGVCREQFMCNEIPKEWNDLPVDYVITEATVYACRKNGAS